MVAICRCGQRINFRYEDWGCLSCGAQCCPACAYCPEGVIFCLSCAKNIFGVIPLPQLIPDNGKGPGTMHQSVVGRG
jgi:hypothetical protein